MKKLLVIFLVLASVLLVSNFTSIHNTSAQTTVTNKVASAGILAPPSLFPTNATFETKAEVIGNSSIVNVGGTSGIEYYAQSFKALSDYIVNGGLSLRSYTGTTPDFRLFLCNSTLSGFANVQTPMAISQVIPGTTLTSTNRRFYLNLTTPIHVEQNKTYWLVIDGYYDHTTAGAGGSLRLGGDRYPDGYFTWSSSNGTSWTDPTAYDLDFVVNFSNRPNKAEVFGVSDFGAIGGTSGPSQYFAQSFKALDAYIVDAGVWIANYSGTTPNFKVQIWGTNATGYPDKNNIIATSRVISGSEIDATPGRFFVHPNVSISVTVGETYWLVIDGYSDHTTNGNAGSRWTLNDVYKDGYFIFSNNIGSSWNFVYDNRDLDFVVTFSASRSAIKMMKGGGIWQTIGGTGSINYAGQSFKALNKYILDAGVWLENYTNLCPTVRLLLCQSTLSNASQPDVVNFLANSTQITGEEISNNHGMYYLKPTTPVEVVPGQTYFFIIDGWTLDNSTAGSIRTYDRSDNPYKDGAEIYSRNAGATWNYYLTTYDLGVDITFSDVPYEAQAGKNRNIHAVGGTAITPYYAQSFIALNDYVADAGVSIIPYQAPTPDFQLLLCENNATGSDHPNLNNVLAKSLVIRGTSIDANPGLFYIKPTTPVPVQRFQKYWIIIDGLTYNASSGRAQSEGVDYDAYPDGEFLWAYKNPNQGWFPYSAYDLHFDVTFTHVNQPPTQPDVTISPLKPFDSNDLTALWPIPSTDFEMEPITYYIEWYKNSVLQPAWSNNLVLPNSATSPTDNWMVKVTPYDGHINGTANTYTVHVLADILTIDHLVTAESQPFHVITKSNTTITDFAFNHTGSIARLNFTSTGPTGTIGFCNITIPNNLMLGSPWVITVNGYLIDPPKANNGTHTTIILEYLFASSVSVMIQGDYTVPEFTPTMLLITLAIATLAIAVVTKKINKKKQ